MRNDWTDMLRKQQEEFEMTPPEGLWEDIAPMMGRSVPMFARIAGIAAAAALLIGSAVGVILRHEPENLIAVDDTVIEPPAQIEIPAAPTEYNTAARHFTVHKRTADQVITEDAPSTEVFEQSPAADAPAQPKTTGNGKRTVQDESDKVWLGDILFEEQVREVGRRGRIAIGISGGNSRGFTSISNAYEHFTKPIMDMDGSNYPSQSITNSVSYNAPPPSHISALTTVAAMNGFNKVQTKTEHRQPIKTALTMRYYFGYRFSADFGLVWTMLLSQTVSGGDTYNYEMNRRMQYAGLSADLSYDIMTGRRLNAYLSCGTEADLCISNKGTVTSYGRNVTLGSESGNMTKDRPQWSVTVAAGAQYSITPLLGAYVQPGLSYYFNNGSDVETVYKERPLQPSLKFGIRFSL